MDIITSHAQIIASDSDGSCGANVHRAVQGYVADLALWGDAIYVARKRGESGLHLLIAPNETWESSIVDDKFTIIGKLTDLVSGT